MAARLSPKCDELTRLKIRTTQLLKRLEAFALSDIDPQTGNPVKMSKEQITAASVLLRKVIPDLANVSHSGDETNPVLHEIRRVIVDPKNNG